MTGKLVNKIMTDEEKASLAASVPLGPMSTPDNPGKTALFLACNDSAHVTGIKLFMDGGAS